jgi:hypothetical protein
LDYSDAYLREYLPDENPPMEQVPWDVIDEIESRGEFVGEDPELLARSTRWTYAIFSELGLGRYRSERPYGYVLKDKLRIGPIWPPHDLRRVSFGLFDQASEQPGLGLILDVPQWQGPTFAIIDFISFPRLYGTSFPLAIRQSEIDLHVAHPSGATSACWAQCRTTSLWGVLTAGHAVRSNRPGSPVPMAAGNVASLCRSYFQPVDAAFVQTPTPSHKPAPLPVLSFGTMGMPVTVDCQSAQLSRYIVEVQNNCGVLNTREVGVSLYLDQPAAKGDSGALIRAANGGAIGLYRGSINVPGAHAGQRGLAQNFEQAILALDVLPYL